MSFIDNVPKRECFMDHHGEKGLIFFGWYWYNGFTFTLEEVYDSTKAKSVNELRAAGISQVSLEIAKETMWKKIS